MKRHLLFIVILLSCKIGISQISGISIGSGNQKFVEDAVKDGLFIVNQKYCLVDDSMRYFGRGNREYFGQTISLGVKVDNGYIVDLKAVAPQKFDSDFNAYADRYSAKIKKTEYCPIGDTVLKPLRYSEAEIDTLIVDKIFYHKSNVFENKGFMTEKSNGDKNGWLVWVLSDNTGYSIQVIRGNVRFIGGETEYNIEKLKISGKEILGGVFVVPQNTAIGQVTFKLAGVIGKNGEQWVVVRLPENNVLQGRVQNLTPLNVTPSDNITPADTTHVEPTIIEDNTDESNNETDNSEQPSSNGNKLRKQIK